MKNIFTLLAIASLLASTSLSQAQTICLDGFAGEYACDGYDLYTHFPLSAVGGGDNGNDCWGWVDSDSGREFVLYGRSNGMSVVEITDPLAPSFIANLPTASSPSLWRDIKVIGNYAYIVSEAGMHGMQILDLTQVLDLSGFPFSLSATANYVGFGNSHNLAVNTETNFAYAIGTNTFGGGLHIVDVSDPINPMLAGSYDGAYSHDIQVVVYQGADEDYQGSEIVFAFNGSSGIEILNVEDKTDIQVISHQTYVDGFYTHQGWLSEDHHMLYFNDELDEMNIGNNTRTYMMNVDDLDVPVLLGFYESTNPSIDHNLYTHNGLIYASNYTSGLRVSTILEDGSIEPQGFFDTYPSNDEASFDGTWSNYPYFPSGSIAVSNFDGLFILRASAPVIGVEENITETPSLGLSPNPASSSVLLTGTFLNSDIIIFDLSGREALRVNTVPALNGLNLDITSLKEGAYMVSIRDSKTGAIKATEKLVVSLR
ncbi:MAG: choice-of-anchor B family protein [Flavobacteriales bacterium]